MYCIWILIYSRVCLPNMNFISPWSDSPGDSVLSGVIGGESTAWLVRPGAGDANDLRWFFINGVVGKFIVHPQKNRTVIQALLYRNSVLFWKGSMKIFQSSILGFYMFWIVFGVWSWGKTGGQTMRNKWAVRCFFTCPVNDEPTALKNQGTTDKKGDGTSWYQMFEGELSWRAPVLHKKPQPRDICAMASVSPINSSALSRSCTNKLHDRISNEPCLSQTVDVFKTLVLFDICGFAGLQEKLRCSRQLFLISPIFTWWKFEIQAWELPLLHL